MKKKYRYFEQITACDCGVTCIEMVMKKRRKDRGKLEINISVDDIKKELEKILKLYSHVSPTKKKNLKSYNLKDCIVLLEKVYKKGGNHYILIDENGDVYDPDPDQKRKKLVEYIHNDKKVIYIFRLLP